MKKPKSSGAVTVAVAGTTPAAAHFTLTDGSDFSGHFVVIADPSYTPTDTEKAYLLCLVAMMAALAKEPAVSAALAHDFAQLRADYCGALRKRAQRFVALATAAERAVHVVRMTEESLRDEGAYQDRHWKLTQRPFEIAFEDKPAKDLVTDVIINTRDVPIPEAKQKLKVEIAKAATVVKAVLESRDKGRRGGQRVALEPPNARKLDEYMRALAGIARVGLINADPSQAAFATLSLNDFKDEFVAREAGLIKNAYVLRLGIAAFVAIALCLGAYFAIENYFPSLLPQKNFLWLFMGAAAGAWLSFSIRRVSLSFTDLAVLEEDRLRPELRVVFVIVLTAVVGLIFWTGMARISVGQFNTDFGAPFNRDVALLIGAFCGLAERTLSTAVYRRAEDFATGVGGSRAPPAK